MSAEKQPLSQKRPIEVAVIGSGPAGFYTADFLLKSKEVPYRVDMFERLPVPFGLVRFGVAPDHQKIKAVCKAFERTAQSEHFRFFGNIDVGADVTVDELSTAYDQVVYAVGSPSDRRMGIDGEDLLGSHPATRFVGWYNGHPDFLQERFDLGARRAVVVGMGNVAMDVTRILVKDPKQLEGTDIASYALDALRKSRVEEVVLLGRRGPAQAAFDARELEDIAELEGVQVLVDPECLTPAEDQPDAAVRKNLELLHTLACQPKAPGRRYVVLRFLSSPVELKGEEGRVTSVRLEHNELVERADGSLSARGTGRFDELGAGLVLRSIGYHGVALPGLPFDEKSGTISNQEGRVTQGRGGPLCERHYVVGWIKRGPTGLIGTNKSDARETTLHMIADAAQLQESPRRERAVTVDRLLAERKLRAVSFADWRRLDELEQAAGQKLGKIREKFYTCRDMLGALD